MSELGGWFDPWGGQPDTVKMKEMSRAMPARGGGRREAFVGERAWLFCNLSSEAEEGLSFLSDTRLRMQDGKGGGGLTVDYDRERNEMLLQRDPHGGKPLYYTCDGRALLFASALKGLFRLLPEGMTVSVERLRDYLFGPCRAEGGKTLYEGIRRLEAGCGQVTSRLGQLGFDGNGNGEEEETDRPDAPAEIALRLPFVCPEENTLRQILTELLFAYDFPAFDCRMPAHLMALSEAERQKKSSLLIEDGTLHTDIGYAEERADRLGRMRGVSLRVTAPTAPEGGEKELKKLDRALKNLLESENTAPLTRLCGEDWQGRVNGEKNLPRRIRLRGMLWQTLLWQAHYPLRFC